MPIFLRMNTLVLEQCKHNLATQVLRSWGALQLRVNGASMIPTLWPGDLLTLRSQNFEQIEPGNLVLYVREEKFIVHRAIRKLMTADGEFLITQGDCVAREDAPVPATALLGTVSQIQRHGLVLATDPQFPLGHRILASLLCRWDLLRKIVLRLRVHGQASPDFAIMQSAS
jgi:signal peptidase I